MFLFVGIVCGDSWTRIVVVRWAVSAICCMTKLHSIAQIAVLHCCAENYFFCMENCFEKLSHTPLEGIWLALRALLWCVVLFSMRSRKKKQKKCAWKTFIVLNVAWIAVFSLTRNSFGWFLAQWYLPLEWLNVARCFLGCIRFFCFCTCFSLGLSTSSHRYRSRRRRRCVYIWIFIVWWSCAARVEWINMKWEYCRCVRSRARRRWNYTFIFLWILVSS